jgi:recombination protein RecA
MNPEEIVALMAEKYPPLPATSIPTGSVWLDRALGIGGWPMWRISEVYGDPGVGTSTLALHTLAEGTKRGQCLLVDRGHSFDYHYAAEIGVDLAMLMVTYEPECIPYMHELELLVIDGPQGLPPNVIPPNQTVLLIGQGYSSTCESSVKVRLRQDGIWPGGQSVTVQVVENAYAPPPTGWGHLNLYYGKGFSRVEEVLTLAFDCGLLDRRGTHYYLNGSHVASSWDKLVRCVESNPAMLERLTAMLMNRPA